MINAAARKCKGLRRRDVGQASPEVEVSPRGGVQYLSLACMSSWIRRRKRRRRPMAPLPSAAAKPSAKHVKTKQREGSAETNRLTIGSNNNPHRAPEAGHPCSTPRRKQMKTSWKTSPLNKSVIVVASYVRRSPRDNDEGMPIASRHCQIHSPSAPWNTATTSNRTKAPGAMPRMTASSKANCVSRTLASIRRPRQNPRCAGWTSVAAMRSKDAPKAFVTSFWQQLLSVSGRNCAAAAA